MTAAECWRRSAVRPSRSFSLPCPPRSGAARSHFRPARSEEEVRREFWALAGRQHRAGVHGQLPGRRRVPPRHACRGRRIAAAWRVLHRLHALTSPRSSQGTLQAIFEFQTFVCQLTGMEVANASLYDGATAVVEAVLMAHRLLPDRPKVVVAGSLHPDYRAVLDTYCAPQGLTVATVPADAQGRLGAAAAAKVVGNDTCAVVVQSPNFFGVIEDLPAVGAIAKGAGALAVQAVAEATSLGILKPGRRFRVRRRVRRGPGVRHPRGVRRATPGVLRNQAGTPAPAARPSRGRDRGRGGQAWLSC